jgi:hypothetical protein
MRKVYQIKKLIAYLDSVNYPITEDEVHQLLLNKDIPHRKPLSNMIVFDLDHIDWWITEKRLIR